ncbi:MAG: hypothetical protein AAGG68_10090 [Bacteroidota bacterium]
MKPILILVGCFFAIASFGQIAPKDNKTNAPKTPTLKPIDVGNTTPTHPLHSQRQAAQKQNTQQNNITIQQRNESKRRREEAERLIAESKQKTIEYDFPSKAHLSATAPYQAAYQEIVDMLEGKQAMSLKRAVFVTENAFYDNQYKYEWHNLEIAENVELIKQSILQEGYSLENETARKWGIHQFMADTIILKNEQGKVIDTHYPLQYDFKDPFGEEDWQQQFVTKLDISGKGQCHSLPLKYLILAEELEVEAWLAHSPSHTYIKLKDAKGNWLNYETTNGSYATDAWVQSSGFIKAEALRNRIYMDTLSKKEVIASQLLDLAQGYARKHGLDPFFSKCLEKTLEYAPKNITALQLKADYETYRVQYIIQQLGFPPPEHLPSFPKAHKLHQAMIQNYQKVEASGYETMPENIYTAWLKSFEQEKAKHPERIIRP